MMTTPSCPPAVTLSAWLDDELTASESAIVRDHLEDCTTCREQTRAWVHAAQELQPDPMPQLHLADECLPDEILVAYSEAELSKPEATRVERHLGVCDRCLGEVQRLVRLSVAVGNEAMGSVPSGSAKATERAEASRPVDDVGRRLVAQLGETVRSIGQILLRPWPVLGAVATAAVLAVAIGRSLPFGAEVGEVQLRGVASPAKVEVIADDVPAHAGPSDDEPIVARLGRGIAATKLAESGDWTRLELPDGGRVWVWSAQVRLIHTEGR